MIRILSLTIFALLLLAGYFLPSADSLRMAAFRSGGQLDSELVEISGPGWQSAVDVGDRVRLDSGPEATVRKVEGDLIWLTEDTGPDGTSTVEHVAQPRASLTQWISSTRTLLSVLGGDVGVKVLGEGEQQQSQILLGTVVLKAPGLESALSPSEGSMEARRSVIRKLRSSVENLSDHNLETPTPGAVSLTIESLEDSTTRITATTLTGLTFRAKAESQAPSLLSLLPPLIAILMAILFRRPVLSLFLGVLGGSWLVQYLAGASIGTLVGAGTWSVVDTYFKGVIADQFYLEIIVFVVAMLAMVGIMTRSGGVQGLMDRISRLAHSARRTQIATWFMGLAIFFDDYANTILVGSTMRPLTDRFKVAREKLAYIVDSTAAPVAGLSLLSTWIAFEVSTFSHSLPDAGLSIGDGYAVFLHTLPYRFYCLFTLFFVGLVVFSGRDFGPMLRAEERARTGQLLNPGSRPMVSQEATDLKMESGIQARAVNALLPLFVFVAGTLASILHAGGAFRTQDMSTFQGWTQVLYDGSGATPLMHGALAGLLTAIVLGLQVGVRKGLVTASISSVRSMGVAIAILYLAWMLGAVCSSLETSTYLTVQLGDAIPPLILPVALFLLSALIAFSTGSSWTTMTILLPLVVGLAFRLGETTDLGGYLLMVMSIGAVLEGAIFGDHCSPISDTTVMSSIASASDHIDHVRTQMPYALLTMGTALVLGYLPAAYLAGRSGSWLPFACLAVGSMALTAILFTIGRKAQEPGGS